MGKWAEFRTSLASRLASLLEYITQPYWIFTQHRKYMLFLFYTYMCHKDFHHTVVFLHSAFVQAFAFARSLSGGPETPHQFTWDKKKGKQGNPKAFQVRPI